MPLPTDRPIHDGAIIGVFKDVAVGGRFRWAYGWPPSKMSDKSYVKVSARRYRTADGRTWMSGGANGTVVLEEISHD